MTTWTDRNNQDNVTVGLVKRFVRSRESWKRNRLLAEILARLVA